MVFSLFFFSYVGLEKVMFSSWWLSSCRLRFQILLWYLVIIKQQFQWDDLYGNDRGLTEWFLLNMNINIKACLFVDWRRDHGVYQINQIHRHSVLLKPIICSSFDKTRNIYINIRYIPFPVKTEIKWQMLLSRR